jgi:hypothetical protein
MLTSYYLTDKFYIYKSLQQARHWIAVVADINNVYVEFCYACIHMEKIIG